MHGLTSGRKVPLALAALLACFVSVAMWRTHERGSLLHTADIYCARALFGLLLYHTRGNPPILPVGAASLYVLCDALLKAGDYDAAMWSHLAFRFCGYWWTHLAIIGSEPGIAVYAFISAAYWGHCFCAWGAARRKGPAFSVEQSYLGGCARLCLLIAAVGAIRPFFGWGF